MPASKTLFLENDELRKAHIAIVNSDAFEVGVVYALADYAADNPTAEQLAGVGRFLDRFRNLANKDEERENTFAAPRLIPPELLVPEKD